MTDGPFRNSKLSPQWKRYGSDLESDAVSVSECSRRAERALADELCKNSIPKILKKLKVFGLLSQFDLNTNSVVDKIFDEFAPSPQATNFKRIIMAEIKEDKDFESCLSAAWKVFMADFVRASEFRMKDELIRAYEKKKIKSKENLHSLIQKSKSSIYSIDHEKMGQDLEAKGQKAFSEKRYHKSDIDDGPEE